MSVTLKCDFPGCEATGPDMHGVEAIYGFGSPDMKIGGHFCRDCWKEHLAQPWGVFQKLCNNLTPRSEMPEGVVRGPGVPG